jgi:membrane protein
MSSRPELSVARHGQNCEWQGMKDAIALVRQIARNIERKHMMLAAAGMAYYFLMSLAPVLIVLVAVVAYLPLQNGMEGVTAFIANVMPRAVLPALEKTMNTISPHRNGLLSFGLITAVWLASKAVKGIIMGLDTVYGAKTPRRIWTNRILAFGLTLGVGLLMVLGVVLMLAGPLLGRLFSTVAPIESLWVKLWPYVQWLLSALIIFSSIEVMYVLAPNVPLAGRRTVPGALFAAVSWVALAWGFGFYLNHYGAKLDNFYGVLAAPIAFMIWLYWSSGAILLGAEINSSLDSYKSRVVPHLPPRVYDLPKAG